MFFNTPASPLLSHPPPLAFDPLPSLPPALNNNNYGEMGTMKDGGAGRENEAGKGRKGQREEVGSEEG